MRVKFQFYKMSMISTSFSLTIKGYQTSIINLNSVLFSAEVQTQLETSICSDTKSQNMVYIILTDEAWLPS